MAHKTVNQTFLAAIDRQTRDEILSAVANQYGITQDEALEEVTHDEAEHLLEYLTGSIRAATSAVMARYGLVPN